MVKFVFYHPLNIVLRLLLRSPLGGVLLFINTNQFSCEGVVVLTRPWSEEILSLPVLRAKFLGWNTSPFRSYSGNFKVSGVLLFWNTRLPTTWGAHRENPKYNQPTRSFSCVKVKNLVCVVVVVVFHIFSLYTPHWAVRSPSPYVPRHVPLEIVWPLSSWWARAQQLTRVIKPPTPTISVSVSVCNRGGTML